MKRPLGKDFFSVTAGLYEIEEENVFYLSVALEIADSGGFLLGTTDAGMISGLACKKGKQQQWNDWT